MSISQQHFGLLGVRERAEEIGGRQQIQGQPSVGTTVEVIVPVAQRNHRG